MRQLVKKFQWREKYDGEDGTTTLTFAMDRFVNRFEALATFFDEDNDEEYDEESDGVQIIIQERKEGINSAPIKEETEIYTIEQDLIDRDDRLQACTFLYTMEELMHVVASHYRMLKVDVEVTNCADAKGLMQCAMAANTCMYSVQRAEATLAINFPYLSSFYDVLAIVFLTPVIKIFEQDVLAFSPSEVRKKCEKEALVRFLGGIIVKCGFRNKNDLGRQRELCRMFSRKTGLTEDHVNNRLCKLAHIMTTLEILTESEMAHPENQWMRQALVDSGINGSSHQWLKHHEAIGGNDQF